jgi:hypothetical protein
LGPAPDSTTQAQLLSWAIFGAALQWSALPQKTSANQKAHEVMTALEHLGATLL